ncbi:hypothetical protein [Rummeliibacillus sp. SL167]|uniref:hypothetical protein n=1 Tax=Rummeliibacillus sp. SL167 TaxID=2579792 RepID=UPI0011B36275|nr:hypothetical protein [Rummeliibacillus sp. SL167]
MIAIMLVFLFIGQILSFYFIILLYTKISRLKDVEKSQARLKDEMDNAIGAYLAEMRDENDRLIKELALMNKKSLEDKTDREHSPQNSENGEHSASSEEIIKPTFNMPRRIVTKAYQNSSASMSATTTSIQTAAETAKDSVDSEVTLTFEEQIQELYRNGKSIDEIARLLQKGKTEIELLLKFQH